MSTYFDMHFSRVTATLVPDVFFLLSATEVEKPLRWLSGWALDLQIGFKSFSLLLDGIRFSCLFIHLFIYLFIYLSVYLKLVFAAFLITRQKNIQLQDMSALFH